MAFRKATLVQLSIRKCGFNLLHDHIPLGTQYEIDPIDTLKGYEIRCGGCGAKNKILMVAVKPSGYLPLKVFAIDCKP